MKDKRNDKIARHFDIFLNGQKFRVISCKIDEVSHVLSIKTKIFGQSFPHSGRFIITIPSENTVKELCISFQSMGKDPAIEHWKYTISVL